MNVDYKVIGARIQAERKRRGFTQESLAERLDVTVGYVSQVERGITKISLDLLASIAAILECDLSTLVTGTATETKEYLATEIGTEFSKLTRRERRLVLEFVRLLIENRMD